MSIDPGTYRDADEVEAALKSDPLVLARESMIAGGVAAASLDMIDAAAKAEIDTALAVAGSAPWPQAQDAYEDIMNSGAGVWR